MALMNETEISAKILQHKKNQSFYYQIHTKKKKNYQANSPGLVCILQIFGNNMSRAFRVRAETKCGGSGRTLKKQ